MLYRQEMCYNNYIPGRNDPFMKAVLHMYCHLQQSWLSCVQAVQAMMHMWLISSCGTAMPSTVAGAILGAAPHSMSNSALPALPACAGADVMKNVNTVQMDELSPEIIAAARARRSRER